jgi:hypothetical protein
VFERRGNNWKTNVGTSVLTEVTVTDRYRAWADHAATTLGYTPAAHQSSGSS